MLTNDETYLHQLDMKAKQAQMSPNMTLSIAIPSAFVIFHKSFKSTELRTNSTPQTFYLSALKSYSERGFASRIYRPHKQNYLVEPHLHQLTENCCFPTRPTWELLSRHYHNFGVCCRGALRAAVRAAALVHGSESRSRCSAGVQSVQQKGFLFLAKG